jgi:NTE family protein
MLVRELLPMKSLRASIFAVLLVAATQFVVTTLAAQPAPGQSHAAQTSTQPSAQTTAQPAHRVRVALALSGGGSLGLAHIGVLQYFEEHHIPVDAIAGTSMGGIVGGFYAAGNSPAQIEAVIDEAQWDDLLRLQARYKDLPMQAKQDRAQHPADYVLRLGRSLSLPAGLSSSEPLDLFLSRQVLAYSTVEDFAQLPTPFRCVATQLETGEAFVLSHGNLARALRATMSVPGIFTPVNWEGHVLVDGGLVDNLPTDVARDMGADVVIAVHFNTPIPPARQLQSLPNVLTQAVSVAVSLTERESLRNADLVLAPSLTGISGIDYKHARELIERGYQSAAQKGRFLATLALTDDDWERYQAERRSRMKPSPPQAIRLTAHSSDPTLARYAQAEFDRADGPYSLEHIERELSTFAVSSGLPSAFYRLSPAHDDAVVAEVEPRNSSQLFIRPTLEFAVANGEPTRGTLRSFATWLPQDAYQARYRVQFSIGYSPQVAAEYEHPIATGPWFWSPAINLERHDSATYDGGSHFTHWQDTYSAAFSLGYEMSQRLRVRAGLEAGYEQFSDRELLGALPVRDGVFLAPRLLADWNSLDDPSLPTHGTLFEGSMAARYRRSDGRTVPLGRVSLDRHFPFLSGTITASLNAASSFGAALNYFDLFPLGGSADLRAFRYEQFHATSYALGALAYRKPFGGFKILGRPPQFGMWYGVAGLVQPLQTWQSAQSGSLGLLLNSPLGVVTFAVGQTSDHQTRAWINVGRP